MQLQFIFSCGGSNNILQVIQRRVDSSVDFYLNWADYKNGFGDPSGNVWLGTFKGSMIYKKLYDLITTILNVCE